MADRAAHHARATGRPYLERPGLTVTRLGPRGWYVNLAVVLQEPADWDDVLADVGRVIPPGVPATVLSPFGWPRRPGGEWTKIGEPPLMVRAVASTPPPSVPAELQIREVVDRATLETFEHTLVDAYPMPDLQPYEWGGFYDERVLGGASRLWLGTVDGRPVATAAAHVAAGVNDVEMVSTAAGARGHGYGGALTWTATTADPSLPAVLIASDLGRPVYEQLGYEVVTRWQLWLRP